MSYLTDGTITVSLEIDWGIRRQAVNILNTSRTVGGRDQRYFWANFQTFNIPLSNVPSSDAAQINEWWRSTDELTLYFDSTSYQTYITGNTQPFQQLVKPYQIEWNGVIPIERI